MSEFDSDLIVEESEEVVDLGAGDLSPLAKRRLIENRLDDMKLQRELEYYEYVD